MTVQELREKLGLSKTAFAKTIGVVTTTITNYESGKSFPNEKIAAKIKEVYGVTVDTAEKVAAAVGGKAEEIVEAVQEIAAKIAVPEETEEQEAPAAEAEAVEEAKADEVCEAAPATQIIIQSAMGGEITPEEIIAKTGNAERVYVRIDENKAYWVKGEETGAVDLW